MTHLTPQQFVDAVDGVLAASQLEHVEQCDACGRELAELRALLGEAQSAGAVPEPSPLFWDHFANRVHAATRVEPIPVRTPWWQGTWRPLVAVGAVLAVGALVLVVSTRSVPREAPPAQVAAVEPGAASDSALAVEAGLLSDQQLDAMAQLAQDVPWDQAAEAARPTTDATAAMVAELTPEQRAEFARLIKAQMGGE